MPVSPPAALLIVIAEAEPLVRTHRLRFDPVAARGVPAHVTAIYPFVPRDDLDGEALARVARVAATRSAFDYRFSETAWFDRDYLYLAPDDPAPFTSLTEALVHEFPAFPPYEGVHDEVVPHLTVGHSSGDAGLDAAEVEIRTRLPVSGRAEHLTVMTEDDTGRWSVLRRVPLGL